jgi:N-acetyl-anhydromuramyl-L-alanine amidase AmpD
MYGPHVERIPIHPTWYYNSLSTPDKQPKAIVAHYSATAYGTAVNMAKRRSGARTAEDRAASWHVSIEGDGRIIQMAPFTKGCWHAGGKTCKPIPGHGKPNLCSVGIELIGDGTSFPDAQVDSACRVWKALVYYYKIDRKDAMYQHSELDPSRRKDPGPVWMKKHAEKVLDYAFAKKV